MRANSLNYLSSILVVVAIVIYFSTIFYGLDFTDSFYHINEAIHPVHDQYKFSFILSSLFINFIARIFGEQVIVFRFINSLLLLIPGLITIVFLRKIISKKDILNYITILLILTTSLNTNILGYDTLTTVILTLIFFTCYSYLINKKGYKILLLSVLVIIAVFIRFPNLILIPILFALLLFEENYRDYKRSIHLKIPMLYVVLTSTITLSVFYLINNNFSEHFLAEINTSSHKPGLLLISYLKDLAKIFGFSLYFILTYKVLSFNIGRARNIKMSYFLFYLAQFFLAITVSVVYKYNFTLYYVSIAFSFVTIYLIENKFSIYGIKFKIIILFIFMLFIHPFGSNTGLLKAAFLFLLFPFLLIILSPKNARFWIGNLILICFLGITVKVISPYEDDNMWNLNAPLNIHQLYLVRTTKQRADYITDITYERQRLLGKDIDVYFYGNKSHIFNYLYPSSSLGISDFNQNLENSNFQIKIQNILKKKRNLALFLTTSYPNKIIYSSQSLLEKELMELGFEKVLKNQVLYYLKTTD
ncbi:hypothetical protein [Gillisia sp. Hel1_33_143]|uniref:hypothetical protein n=1 Tax=Gillisia sp. Hel1_33_143 TaxID=1336796 RepID=UPI001560D6C6|nr:hypothetical protein [Gillisia sp. Hel1_33_143]